MLLVQTEESFIQLPTGFYFYTYCHIYACIAQLLYTSSCHQRVGVQATYHHASHTFADNQVSTGGRLTIMRAGLKRYIQG